MKLRSLAALLFRLLGAMLLVDAITQALGAVIDGKFGHLVSPTVPTGLAGYCFIYYSKSLAALFCKGLDDNPE